MKLSKHLSSPFSCLFVCWVHKTRAVKPLRSVTQRRNPYTQNGDDKCLQSFKFDSKKILSFTVHQNSLFESTKWGRVYDSYPNDYLYQCSVESLTTQLGVDTTHVLYEFSIHAQHACFRSKESKKKSEKEIDFDLKNRSQKLGFLIKNRSSKSVFSHQNSV